MPRTSPLRRLAVALLGGTAAFAAGGCGTAASRIEVTGAVVPVPATADTASAYLTITNTGDLDDELLDVSTPSASTVGLHETKIDADGRARMTGVGTVTVPAGGTVELRPGGVHLMLMQPDELSNGDEIELTLTFRHAGTETVAARVTDDADALVGT